MESYHCVVSLYKRVHQFPLRRFPVFVDSCVEMLCSLGGRTWVESHCFFVPVLLMYALLHSIAWFYSSIPQSNRLHWGKRRLKAAIRINEKWKKNYIHFQIHFFGLFSSKSCNHKHNHKHNDAHLYGLMRMYKTLQVGPIYFLNMFPGFSRRINNLFPGILLGYLQASEVFWAVKLWAIKSQFVINRYVLHRKDFLL